MAKIKKIKENGVTIYPATIMQAVKDPNTGQRLDEKLSELGSQARNIASNRVDILTEKNYLAMMTMLKR